ncbi:MAG: histidine triad nucleotide-binding protein [Chloroflexi bacterium]|nr:histidine triad nucleotide-binding protein [Chloroflexota bacterium]
MVEQHERDREPACLFCKIVAGDIPSARVYEDDRTYAFRDISPVMPVHTLLIPKRHIANTLALRPEHDAAVGALLRAAQEVARLEGVDASGYRLVVNTGDDALNTVPHLHVHLLGGRKMDWPPG